MKNWLKNKLRKWLEIPTLAEREIENNFKQKVDTVDIRSVTREYVSSEEFLIKIIHRINQHQIK